MTIILDNKTEYPIKIDRAYGTYSIEVLTPEGRISTGTHSNETDAWKTLHVLMNNACFKIRY